MTHSLSLIMESFKINRFKAVGLDVLRKERSPPFSFTIYMLLIKEKDLPAY